MAEILIGTSGYDYPELKGIFYPEKLPRKDFLSFYATYFNALEVNSTFYGMPTAKRLSSFFDRTEGKVQFSIKANRLLTHEISQNWESAAQDFTQAILPLQQNAVLSDVLIQFPESFHYTVDNRVYLAKLIQFFKDKGDFPVVIEFRHKEWIRPSVLEGLNSRNAGIVFCDMPQLKNLPNGETLQTPFIGQQAYIRFHGRNSQAWYANDGSANGSERYNYQYSESELKSFVPIIKAASTHGKKVQLFFNNHPNGNGFKNALDLKKLILFPLDFPY